MAELGETGEQLGGGHNLKASRNSRNRTLQIKVSAKGGIFGEPTFRLTVSLTRCQARRPTPWTTSSESLPMIHIMIMDSGDYAGNPIRGFFDYSSGFGVRGLRVSDY